MVLVLVWTATMSTLYTEGGGGGGGIGGTVSGGGQCGSVDNATSQEGNCTIDSGNSTASPSVSVSSGGDCWEGYTDEPFLLILSVPMIVALAVRESLLFDLAEVVLLFV